MYLELLVLKCVQIPCMHSRVENRLFNEVFSRTNKSVGKKPSNYSEINKEPNKRG